MRATGLRRLRAGLAASLLCALVFPCAAQQREKPVGGSGGGGIQIDLGGLLRTLTGPARGEAINTEWPTREAALALYSLPAELARSTPPDGDLACEPGELLVWWPNAEAAAAGLRELTDRYQLNPILRADLPALGAAVLALYQLPDNEAALTLRTALRAQHPDWSVDLNARSSSSAGPRLYALEQLQIKPAAAPAPAPAFAAAGVRVGVIDGPMDAPDSLHTSGFVAHSVLQPADVPATATHGNLVARLIAGRELGNGFAGAAPGVALHWATVTRVVQGRERSNTWAQVLALDWVLGQAVQLVNVSMGGTGDAVLAAAYKVAASKPVLLLAAAGNGGPAATPVYPAAYPGVVAVTATDAALQVYAWANQGPYVAVAAPGVDLWVPSAAAGAAGTPTPGAYVSGTSFATALATAALARWGEQRLRQAHAEKLAPLCKGARDLGAPGKDAVFGCGLVR